MQFVFFIILGRLFCHILILLIDSVRTKKKKASANTYALRCLCLQIFISIYQHLNTVYLCTLKISQVQPLALKISLVQPLALRYLYVLQLEIVIVVSYSPIILTKMLYYNSNSILVHFHHTLKFCIKLDMISLHEQVS